MRKNAHLLEPKIILCRYHIAYQPPIFDLLAPVEAAHVGGGASFMPYQYMYTRELI